MRNAEKMYITLPVTESVKITAKHPIFIGGYKDITTNTANTSQGKNKTSDMSVTKSVKITAKHPIFIGGTCQSCANNVDLTYTMTRMIAKQVVITDIDKGNI